jgi:hypothetical protein
MKNDPIVEEVRSIRDRLAARFDYDVQAIFHDLRCNQAKTGRRLVRRDARSSTSPADGNERDRQRLKPGR